MYNGVKPGGVIVIYLTGISEPLCVQLSNYGYGYQISGVYARALL